MLLRATRCGVFGTDSFLARPRRKMFLVSSVARRMEMVIYFWECAFRLLLHVRELPEFATLMALDRGNWPRSLLCWLPGLGSAGERDP